LEGRSIWTGRRSASLVSVDVDARILLGGPSGAGGLLVEAQHEEELRRFVAYAERSRTKFWILFSVALASMVAGGAFSVVWPKARWAVAAGALLFALTALVFPFATPQTIRVFGLRRSRQIVRWSSVAMLGLAAWLADLASRT